MASLDVARPGGPLSTSSSTQTAVSTASSHPSWTLLDSHHFFPASWNFEPLFSYYHDPKTGIKYKWSSREHRKGIPAQPVSGTNGEEAGVGGQQQQEWEVERGHVRWIGWDVGDISWWVSITFTVGSVFWCINGILYFCYFTNSSSAFLNTESATAFIGGTLFWGGAYLAWVESMNPVERKQFDYVPDYETGKLKGLDDQTTETPLGVKRKHFHRHLPTPHHHHHHLHANSDSKKDHDKKDDDPPRHPTQVGQETGSGGSDTKTDNSHLSPPTPSPPIASSPSSVSTPSPTSSQHHRKFTYFGRPPILSLSYIANSIQFFGATVFFISVLCGLPGILLESGTGPKSEAEWVGAYWAMQVLGAPCFVIAGGLACLEVQERWWKPALNKLGWHIGIWNVIGGFGFWFCGIFGIFHETSLSNPNLYQKWGTGLSTFWGSWAFLIGSYLQHWEGINKRSS